MKNLMNEFIWPILKVVIALVGFVLAEYIASGLGCLTVLVILFVKASDGTGIFGPGEKF